MRRKEQQQKSMEEFLSELSPGFSKKVLTFKAKRAYTRAIGFVNET